MEDYTASYERLLSSQGGGGGGSPSYRHPPPRPAAASAAGPAAAAPPVFGDLHARIPPVSVATTVGDSTFPARFMANGTGSLPFLGLYGSSGSVGSTPGSSPLGGPTSPYRSGTTGNGLVNNRTFWPPTPPPEAYSRCGVGGNYYPMFSSMSPMVPSSDLTFSCGSLLPRLPSTNPFMHLLSNHKEAPFLPLRLSSPVTSTSHPLSVPPVPYLHLPTPSLDHRYPSTPGLFSPLSLHGIQSGLQDIPKSRHTELDVKSCEKAIKSEPLSLSTSSDKEQFHPVANNTETNEGNKRSNKSSPKVASVKAREKHDAKKEEQKKLPVMCLSQYRKVSPTIPVMTATVLPCNVSPSCSTLKPELSSVKCSKCSTNVEESCKKEKSLLEENKNVVDESSGGGGITMNLSSQNVVVPVSHATVTSTVSTTTETVTSIAATLTSSAGSTLVSPNNNKFNTPESVSKSVTPQTVLETAPSPQAVKHIPTTQLVVKKVHSPTNSSTPPLPSKKGASIGSPVLTSVGGAVESHVSTVCAFSSWVHHQTSVTSVIKQDHPESDSCLHSVQSQMTVVNLSMDKGVVDNPKSSQTAKSESTLIFQMQNTHNAQQVKCHQTSESTEEINCSLLNQNQNRSSKCGVKELSAEQTVCIKELPAEKSVCVKDSLRESVVNVKELKSEKSMWGQDHSVLQQQAINLSVDRSKTTEKDCSLLSPVGQQPGADCDIKKVTEVTATQSLDSLTRLARSPSGTGTVAGGTATGPNSPWNASTNKVKPSSVVSSIQSENLQMTSALKKAAVDFTACSSTATIPMVSVSGATSFVSSPSSQPVPNDCKSDPTLVKVREVICSSTIKEENKVAKVCSILPSHEPSTSSAGCTTISNPIINSSVSSSIPVGIAVAQLRHGNSTAVSIKKAVVKANSIEKSTIPAIIDKGDKRFIKTSITTAADTTMIVNPTPTLNQWDGSSTMVRPATLSGSWLAPAPPVVTPTVWLGPSYQGPAAQSTPCISQPLGSLVEAAPATASALAPPVGYHLARDPITGHLFLIPAPNIDIVDRPSVWSTYSPNPVQQVISHFPTTINGTKKELKPLLTSPQILEKPDLPILQPRLLQASDQTLPQEIKDIKSLNTAVQSSVTSITVQTGQPFAFPGFTAAPQPALSYFYDQPTIVHIAQTQTAAPSLPTVTQVQAEPGKRSQGTSPLNSVTPSPPPQPCTQVSEYESDAESVLGSETSNKASVGVTASCQVDMDACSNNSNDMDYEERTERTVEVFDSANQTDHMLLESLKEEPEDLSPASLVVREDNEDMEDIELASDLKQEVKQEEDEEEEDNILEPVFSKINNNNNNNTNGNFEAEEEEVPAPVLPSESKPVIDFIDQHGLNLLVDSIEEFASREQKEINPDPISIRFTSGMEVNTVSELDDTLNRPQVENFTMESGCTDGLGLLCALAEQRFLEETKNCEEDEDRTVTMSRARSCSPDMPYRLQGQPACHKRGGSTGVRSGSLSSSRCHSPVLLNPAELEMRFKLAELQRKYKIRQKELAKLKSKKDRDSSSSEGSASHLHIPSMRECLEESSKKKKSKSSPHNMLADSSSPLKLRTACDVPSKLTSPSAQDHFIGSTPASVQEVKTFPSPVKTTSYPAIQVAEKAHPVFPNLVKISTKKILDSKLVNSDFRATACKQKSTSKKKVEKNEEKNIFQLWKDKKLEELSRGISHKSSCVPHTKVKVKPKPLAKTPEESTKIKVKSSPSKIPTSKLESNPLPEFSDLKTDNLKRKVEALTPEVTSENDNVKRPKLEEQQDPIQKEPEIEDIKDIPPLEKQNNDEKLEVKPSPCTEAVQKTKKREKRPSINSDDVWNRRRSERIFLHDAGVILPSSLAYTNQNSLNNNNNCNINNMNGNKSPKSPEPPKKKMTRKELGIKKQKFKEAAEKQNQVPLEMFLALRQCRLNEMGFPNGLGLFSGNPCLNTTSSQDDSSGSEGDLPLSQLRQAEKRNFFVPELPPCQMHVCDLRDCQRVLMEEDGLYYAGYITAIQAPDVYGITLDRERGNRPHIFSREEMLEQTVKEVKPFHVKQIPEGTRVCAYWSQQYRCLYPGTVTKGKGNSEEPSQEKNTVFVEFDDGDSGRIPLEDVRLLLPDPNYQPPNINTNEKEESSEDQESCTAQAKFSMESSEISESQANEKSQNGASTSHCQDVNENSSYLPKVEALKCKSEKTGKVKTDKNSKKKLLSNELGKLDGRIQTSKVKKTKSKSEKSVKSKSEEKMKAKSEKNKKKGEKKLQETDIALVGNVGTKVGIFGENQDQIELDDDDDEPLSQLTDENGNCIKQKKVKNLSKLEGKKLSKLKSSSFVLKKAKHHFADSSSNVLEKIKSLKKSHKIKGVNKDKSKGDKTSSDTTKMDSCESGECKVKKRKKHKTEHKHHHHHHKRHCHHHHKKHKRKSETLGLHCSSHPGSPVLTISVTQEPKGSLLSGEDSKLEMPICCVSPGRSELSVKIKASPPSSTSCMTSSVKTTDGQMSTPILDVSSKMEEVEQDKSPKQNTFFLFPEKSATKSGDRTVSVKTENVKKETSNETKSPKKRKERKISCEKSKIAAFLPARQLWRWSGKSFKRPGTKGKAKKEYFKAITRGKETIKVGDCAVFLSTGRPHLPYVGRIETMWQSWGGNTVVKVKWFYHPEETKGGKKLAHPKGALFQSPHVDENDVQTISHKCEVLSWNDYQKWCEKRGTVPKGSFENEDVYYLAGNYEPLTKVLTLEPGVS